jgi:hypothetical protein
MDHVHHEALPDGRHVLYVTLARGVVTLILDQRGATCAEEVKVGAAKAFSTMEAARTAVSRATS